MNTETDYLKTIAEEIASEVKQNHTKTIRPSKYLETEAKRIEKEVMLHLNSIKNYIHYDAFYLNVMNKLVHICDILSGPAKTVTGDVSVIIDLLSNLRALVPAEMTSNVKLPAAFLVLQRDAICSSWKFSREVMRNYGVDEPLICIAGIPFERFSDTSAALCWRDFLWLKSYQAKLEIIDWENSDCTGPTEALMSLLIGRDFNDDRFYIYCKKYIQQRVATVTGKHPKIMTFVGCEKLVLQDTQIGMPSFDVLANTVSARLIKWIREEIDFVETHEKDVPYAKLSFQFYKYTLSFFFKLLHEQKVFGDISFRELSEQIASTCTAMGADVPADSVVKKAYLKKQVDFDRMESLLAGMLDYLRSFK